MKTMESLGCGLYAGAAYPRVNTVSLLWQNWKKVLFFVNTFLNLVVSPDYSMSRALIFIGKKFV